MLNLVLSHTRRTPQKGILLWSGQFNRQVNRVISKFRNSGNGRRSSLDEIIMKGAVAWLTEIIVIVICYYKTIKSTHQIKFMVQNIVHEQENDKIIASLPGGIACCGWLAFPYKFNHHEF